MADLAAAMDYLRAINGEVASSPIYPGDDETGDVDDPDSELFG